MSKLTPESLFDYALAFTNQRIEQKANRLQPKFKEAAQKFRCRISDIQDAIYSYQGRNYLSSIVAYKCAGGVAEIKNKGDFLIEAELTEPECS